MVVCLQIMAQHIKSKKLTTRKANASKPRDYDPRWGVNRVVPKCGRRKRSTKSNTKLDAKGERTNVEKLGQLMAGRTLNLTTRKGAKRMGRGPIRGSAETKIT